MVVNTDYTDWTSGYLFEYGNGFLGSVKGGEVFDYLSDFSFSKRTLFNGVRQLRSIYKMKQPYGVGSVRQQNLKRVANFGCKASSPKIQET
jgi:hypothetical protein